MKQNTGENMLTLLFRYTHRANVHTESVFTVYLIGQYFVFSEGEKMFAFYIGFRLKCKNTEYRYFNSCGTSTVNIRIIGVHYSRYVRIIHCDVKSYLLLLWFGRFVILWWQYSTEYRFIHTLTPHAYIHT